MKQTVIAYLKDKPGVLNQISRLFYRLNYNIESISIYNKITRKSKILDKNNIVFILY